MYGTHTLPRITGPSRRAILPRMGAYTRNIRRAAPLGRLAGLGQADMSLWPVDAVTGDYIDPSSGTIYLDPATQQPVDAASTTGSTGISTSYSTTYSTGTPTAAPTTTPTVVSSNPFTDVLNAITGAAGAAVAVYSAADLIKINQQRAAQGLLPINAAGQIAGRTTTASLVASPLFLAFGIGALFLLTRK
jgi:hypothetical protein